ncbi:hypothetical protein KVP10_08495 [Candidimonas humi]|uniref:Uncharacterized protein n=1 Tax=Candidimonas humi TaxID=683355 RepID=A0ABV8NW01_9BURK|nr:hypothetical protein [Candidimonas humi]MBV6304925.1 hypothetical protein [Candidimonas humi]
MVQAVQRPRGPMGWSPEYSHLAWPGDTTPAQREWWRQEYEAGRRKVGHNPPPTYPKPPPPPSPPPAWVIHAGLRADVLKVKTRFRSGWRGRLVLQVYVPNPMVWPHGFHYPGFVGWRDATIEDLQRLYETGQDALGR